LQRHLKRGWLITFYETGVGAVAGGKKALAKTPLASNVTVHQKHAITDKNSAVATPGSNGEIKDSNPASGETSILTLIVEPYGRTDALDREIG